MNFECEIVPARLGDRTKSIYNKKKTYMRILVARSFISYEAFSAHLVNASRRFGIEMQNPREAIRITIRCFKASARSGERHRTIRGQNHSLSANSSASNWIRSGGVGSVNGASSPMYMWLACCFRVPADIRYSLRWREIRNASRLFERVNLGSSLVFANATMEEKHDKNKGTKARLSIEKQAPCYLSRAQLELQK